ncbi:MAG: LysR family transcriptional regulator [Burkholderiaceae bacterium]
MELYQIRAFVMVARLGNLTRAAEALSVTQPAVTAQIKSLEQLLGVALFERQGGRLVLAKAGEILLPSADALLAAGAELRAQALKLQGEICGHLDFGIPSEHPDFLRVGELVAAMARTLPRVDLHTRTLPAVALAEQVRTGQLAAALTISANPPLDVQWTDLRSVRFRIAIPSALSIVAASGGWRELAALPWVDTTDSAHPHVLLRDLFERHGLSPQVIVRSDDVAALDALVRAGVGCALLREEVALRGAERGDFLVWGHARTDARLGLITASERAGDPMVVGLSSVLRTVWGLA